MGNERLLISSLARILSETEGRPQCTRIPTYMKTITFSADEDLIERDRESLSIAVFLNAVAPNDIGTAVAFTISSPKLWPGLRWV
jgi:hypothetical protein